ncbi:MAG: cell division protein FtsA [Firmicutes bacterium]|nr:cell division protein FtsA [Bacillota bacterium]
MEGAYLAEEHIVAGLDLGTSKVSVVIAAIDSQGINRIMGVGTGSHSGMHRGAIMDPESVAAAIMEAVIKAERMAAIQMPPPVMGIPGVHTSSFAAMGAVDIRRPSHRVQAGDIERALSAAKSRAVPPGRPVVYQSVRAFALDGSQVDGEPEGAVARTLELDAQFVTVALPLLESYLDCLSRAGIEVKEIVVQCLAAADMALAPSHRKLGVVLVDFGAGLTEIALFRSSRLQHLSTLPVGADNLARDLTVGLRISLEEAERLVQGLGCNPWSAESSTWGKLAGEVAASEKYNQVFMARAEEIWQLVGDEIAKVGVGLAWPAGLKLVGGGAMIPGFADLGAKILDMPVEVVIPSDVPGLPDGLQGPVSAAVMGLVQHQVRGLVTTADRSGQPGAFKGLWQKVRDWLRF